MDTASKLTVVLGRTYQANLLSRLAALLSIACIMLAGSPQAFAVNLTDVDFAAKEGGRFQVRLDFDGTPPTPAGYTIEKPARIALDFPDTSSRLEKKKYSLSYGNASSAIILEAGGRTRMILNLIEIAAYDTRVEGNSLFVEIGDSGARDYLKPTKADEALSAVLKPVKSGGSSNGIADIDFKRGDQGEGRLILKLENPKTNVNVFVEGEYIKVDLKEASIPERLQRRYDVSDFATPVQLVEALATEKGALLTLKAVGEYDYLAYQADNDYVVSVKPLSKEESLAKQREFDYVGEKLSLSFQDIEVRAVLQLIADFTGLNLVASDTVAGRITLRLQNVPWDQALELVLKTKGLDKRQVGNVLMVAPAAEIAERERQEIENNKQIEELAPLQTDHIRVRYANAKTLFEMFSGEEEDAAPGALGGLGGPDGGSKNKTTASLLSARGSIIVDERTNSLLVTETAQKLEEFHRVIRLLDVPVKQVLIEARLVIASSDFDEQLGIRWGVGGVGSINGRETYVGRTNEEVMEANNTNVQNRITEINTGEFLGSVLPSSGRNIDLGVNQASGQFAIGYIGSDFHLGLELSALESQGRGEIVSQPKIITGDKQEAVIKSGTEIPYQESSANGETTISFKEAVLKLAVTPSITPDDRIIMTLDISQDSVGEVVPTAEGGSVPSIDTTSLETQVLVGNGETVVLGGVFRTADVHTEAKVPILGDIPYIGRLFKRKSVQQEKTETLIFITPRILADTLID